MRFWAALPVVLGMAALIASPVCAGVYNPGEAEEGATPADYMDGPPGKNFRDVLIVLQSIPVKLVEVDNPVRRRYIFEEEVLTKNPTISLTLADRLQASAVLLRRRKFKEAELLLRPVATHPDERDNFPLQSNFATALHLSGDVSGAYHTLRPVVKDHWKPWNELPDARRQFYKSIGWSDAEYELNHVYDTYYLRLLRLRMKEQLAKKAGKGPVQPPDDIFDDGKVPPTPVRFVGEGGQFAAGRIAAAENAKLATAPRDALAIVQKLLVWMPDDSRLYWLLAELYNAQKPTPKDKENEAGMKAARQIFIELSKLEPLDEEVKEQLKTRLSRLGSAIDAIEKERAQKIEDDLGKNRDAKPDAGFIIDWRTVAISFGAGFVLGLFVTWQVREIQRRRNARLARQPTRSVLPGVRSTGTTEIAEGLPPAARAGGEQDAADVDIRRPRP
jgi:hypothetical protein